MSAGDADGGYAGILSVVEGVEAELVRHRHRISREASVTTVLDLLGDVADLTSRIRAIRRECEGHLNGAVTTP